MNYKIVLSPLAVKNLDDALKFYNDNVSKKIATLFWKDYKRTYNSLKINPFYQFHDNNYRFLPMQKFPFIAFFIVNELENIVYLNAIFHTSQNPDRYPISKI